MFNRILVTTDGSRASHSALPHAEKLAQALGCEVILLYVLDKQNVPDKRGIDSTITVDRDNRDNVDRSVDKTPPEHGQGREAGQRALDQAAELLGLPGVSKLLLEVQHNDVATTITQAAQDQGADLIVMASRGSTGLNHLLMGCIAERVMHRAHVPVLLVRDPQTVQKVRSAPDNRAAIGAAAS